MGTPILRSLSLSLSDGIIEGSLFAFGIFLSGMSLENIFSHGYLGRRRVFCLGGVPGGGGGGCIVLF